MPSRSTGSSSPAVRASSADPNSDAAIGSGVKVRLLPRRRQHLGGDRRPGDGLDGLGHRRLRALGIRGGGVEGGEVALEQRADELGSLLERRGADDQVRGDVRAVVPQVAFVDEDLAAALLDQPGRPRLGHPGAVDLPGHEGLEDLGVLLGLDADVAPTLERRLVALLGEPGPQRDVLGVAELRGGQGRAGEVVGRGDVGRVTRNAPPEVVPATMRSASPPDWANPLIAGFGPM